MSNKRTRNSVHRDHKVESKKKLAVAVMAAKTIPRAPYCRPSGIVRCMNRALARVVQTDRGLERLAELRRLFRHYGIESSVPTGVGRISFKVPGRRHTRTCEYCAGRVTILK